MTDVPTDDFDWLALTKLAPPEPRPDLIARPRLFDTLRLALATCPLTGWVYLEGTVGVSGSHITFTPSAGVARVENACTPGQPRQQPWKDNAKGFTWLFHYLRGLK